MGLLKGLFIFGVGVYAGMYTSQKFNLPPVDKPEELLARARALFEDVNKTYKKPEKGE